VHNSCFVAYVTYSTYVFYYLHYLVLKTQHERIISHKHLPSDFKSCVCLTHPSSQIASLLRRAQTLIRIVYLQYVENKCNPGGIAFPFKLLLTVSFRCMVTYFFRPGWSGPLKTKQQVFPRLLRCSIGSFLPRNKTLKRSRSNNWRSFE